MPKITISEDQLQRITALIFPYELDTSKCFFSTDTDRVFITLNVNNKGHNVRVVVTAINEKEELTNQEAGMFDPLNAKYTKALIKVHTAIEPLVGYETAKVEFEEEVTFQAVLTHVLREIDNNVKPLHNRYLTMLRDKNKAWVQPLEIFFKELQFTVRNELNGNCSEGLNAQRARTYFEKDNHFFEANTYLEKDELCINVYPTETGIQGILFSRKAPLNSSPEKIKKLFEECLYEFFP